MKLGSRVERQLRGQKWNVGFCHFARNFIQMLIASRTYCTLTSSLSLRSVNLNYRFRAVAKGLLRTMFFDKLF